MCLWPREQDLQKEIDGLQDQLAALNDLKYKMAVAYPDADTSDIDQTISDLNQRLLAMNQDLGNRQTKLENALLACGKFQDALQSLLDWLAETRELVENQGPIAATDPNVMKAQMQEQKVSTDIKGVCWCVKIIFLNCSCFYLLMLDDEIMSYSVMHGITSISTWNSK